MTVWKHLRPRSSGLPADAAFGEPAEGGLWRWLVLAVAVYLVLFAMVQWAAGTEARRGALEQQAELLGDRVEQIAGEVSREAVIRRQNIAFLAQVPPVRGIAGTIDRARSDPRAAIELAQWKARLTAIFTAFLESHPDVYQARLIGVADNGRELVRVDRDSGRVATVAEDRLQNKAHRPYFIETIKLDAGAIYVSDINLNQEFGTVEVPHVAVSRYATPVYARQGRVFGLVVLNYDETRSIAAISAQRPENGALYVLNDAGDFIVHPRVDRRFGSDLGHPYGWHDAFADAADPHMGLPPDIRAWRGEQGRVYGVLRDMPRGPGALAPPLRIAMVVPAAVIEAAVSRARLGSAGLWAVVGIVVALLLIGYGRGRARQNRLAARFRLAVETSPNAMLMIDRDGRIGMVNARAETLFGYRHEELLGQPVDRLLPEDVRERHAGLRNGYFTAPTARPMGAGRDLHALTRDRRLVPVEIGLSPNEWDERPVVFVTITDISVRKRAETALAERTRQLAESNRDLEQFAYVASHDLQEPLRGISGCLQLLERDYQPQLDDKGRRYIDLAVSSAGRMHQMINDLLEFSRVGRRGDGVRRFAVDSALDEALRNLVTAIDESGAVIERAPLPELFGDPALFRQLFQNVVGNAIKFRRAGVAPRIRISAMRDEQAHGWRFEVADNGIGIDPRFAEQIFGVFRRLHTARQYPGSGIGLATCKRIVETHHGRIWVEPALSPDEPPDASPESAPGTCVIWVIPDRNDSAQTGYREVADGQRRE